jgi:hypothetical protein
MRRWQRRLRALGPVASFDYDYMATGKKRPDPHARLLARHQKAAEKVAKKHGGPLVLVGKSMGGRIGCHLAVEVPELRVGALVCLGYPLRSPAGKLRDEVLLQLDAPVLFVQGTRDSLCPLDVLKKVRRRMKAPTALHVVEGGSHSLEVGKRKLALEGRTQADVEANACAAIEQFLKAQLG